MIEQIRQLRADVRRRVVDRLAAAQDIAVAQLVHHASAHYIAPTAGSTVAAARALLSEGRAWTQLQDLRDRIGDLEAALATGPPTEDREARLAALRLRLAEIDGDDAPAVTEAELVALERAVHRLTAGGDDVDGRRERLAVKLATMAANLRAPLDIGKPDVQSTGPAADIA